MLVIFVKTFGEANVIVVDDVFIHYLKFFDGKLHPEQNLYVGLVKDDYNKYEELPIHVLF